MGLHAHTGHTVVLTEDKDVWSWGRGDDGRLVSEGGRGRKEQRGYLEAIADAGRFSIIDVSFAMHPFPPPFLSHPPFSFPQGHADNHWKYVPHPVTALSGKSIKQVTCGSYHTVRTSKEGERGVVTGRSTLSPSLFPSIPPFFPSSLFPSLPPSLLRRPSPTRGPSGHGVEACTASWVTATSSGTRRHVESKR